MNYALLRTNMIQQQIRPWSVLDNTVLEIMAKIPREKFVPPAFSKLAYSDTDIPLEGGYTMLSPKVVGKGLQALNLSPLDKVLEVGTGTGYVTACLCELAKEVISLEISESLMALAEKNLKALSYTNVKFIKENGVFGWKKEAPYDAIFVSGSYPLGVPGEICAQLNPNGGRLFAFCGQAPAMEAVLITRTEKNYSTQKLFETVVSALNGAAHAPQFQF